MRRSAWTVQRKVRTSDVVTVEERVEVVPSTRPVHHWLVFAGAFSLFTFFKDIAFVILESLLSLRSGGASKESKKYTDEIGDFEAAFNVQYNKPNLKFKIQNLKLISPNASS